MQGLEGQFSDPNGGAYETREQRVGLPLGYVAQKSRVALAELHDLYTSLLNPPLQEATAMSHEELIGHVQAATWYTLVSHLALTSMLGQLPDGAAAERFLAYSRDDFRRWLDVVDREGSVTG